MTSAVGVLATPPRASTNRIPALDGLRGLAILLVLSWHFFFAVPSHPRILQVLKMPGQLSWSGVDLFFVLSGFLIGGILLDTKESPRYFTTFYARRAYRILPLYSVIIALNYLWPIPFRLYPDRLGTFTPSQVPFLSYLTFTQNWWVAFGTVESIVAGVTWSLAIEEQFYLTIPWLVRKLKRRHLTVLLFCVVVGAPALRILVHHISKGGNYIDYFLTPCRADALSLGVLSALLVRTSRVWESVKSNRNLLYCGAGLLFLVLAWFTYKQYAYYSNTMVMGGYSVVALFYTFCLLIALTDKGPLQRLLCSRALVELGALSYCLYLIHLPVVDFCRRIFGLFFGYQTRAAHVGSLAVGVPLLYVVAVLSRRFFEQPMLRLGHRHRY